MKMLERLRKCVAFIMVIFLITNTLATDAYATGYEAGSGLMSEEEQTDTDVSMTESDDVSGEEKICVFDVSGSDISFEGDVSESDPISSDMGEEYFEDNADDISSNDTEISIEADTEEFVYEKDGIRYIYPSKVMVSLSADTSIHANVFIGSGIPDVSGEDGLDIKLIPETYSEDVVAEVFNEETPEGVDSFFYARVITDDTYLVAPLSEIESDCGVSINSNIDSVFMVGENLYKFKLETVEESMREKTSDNDTFSVEYKLPEISVNTEACEYSLMAVCEGEEADFSFSDSLVSRNDILDIDNLIQTATVEDEVYMKIPVTQMCIDVSGTEITDETEEPQTYSVVTTAKPSKLIVTIGDQTNEITEPVWESDEYFIYKLAQEGMITSDLSVDIILDETKEVHEGRTHAAYSDAYVLFNENLMSIIARVGSKIYYPVSSSVGRRTYNVPVGKTLTIIPTPKKNVKIEGAVINGSSKTTPLNSGEVGIKVSATALNTIEMVATEQCFPVLKDSGENLLTAGKNGYAVKHNDRYIAYVERGVSAAVTELTSYSLTSGKTNLTDVAVTKSGNRLNVNLGNLDASLYAGKTLSLTMKYMSVGVEKSSTIKLVLDYPVKSVTLSGAKWVSDHYEVKLPLGTSKEYTVTTNNKGKVDLKELAFCVGGNGPAKAISYDGVSISFDSARGKLIVSTDSKINNPDGVIISFYYHGVRLENKNAFKVVRETLTLSKSTPSVSKTSSTDRSIDIKLTLPKGFTRETKGLYYFINVNATTGPVSERMYERVSYLVPVNSLPTSNIYSVWVAKSGVEEGQGCGQKYSVSVNLVQCTDSSVGISDYQTKISQIAEIDAVSKIKSISAATQDPYYDTKITVKKVASSLKQGQEDVLLAKFINSAKTTYRDRFQLVSIEKTDKSGTYGVPNCISVDEEALLGGELRVTANKNYYPATDGTYKITVKAYICRETQETTASYSFKITPGIGEIELVSSSETLYKADGKAAKIKMKTYLYGYRYESIKATSKNVRYEIVDEDGYGIDESGLMNPHIREAVEKKWITVSGGNVSVSKKYLISPYAEDNTFRVKAIANDYPGNATSQCSDTIVIVSEPQKIAELRWVEDPYENGGYIDPASKSINHGKKKIPLEIDNSNNIKNHITGYMVALDADGNIVRDLKFESKGMKFSSFYTSHDMNGNPYLYFNTASMARGKYSIKASTNNGVKSSKTYNFEATYSSGIYSYTITGYGAPLYNVTSGSSSATYTNEYYIPFEITSEAKYGASDGTKVEVSGGNLVSSKKKNGVYYFKIVPTKSTTYVYIKHKVTYSGWYSYSYWSTSWTYTIRNEALYSSTERVATGRNNTVSYTSSILTTPYDNTMYAGYSGLQEMEYTLDSGYRYTEGDYVKVYMDMNLDGIKKSSSRKGFREAFFNQSDFNGFGRRCDLYSDGTFYLCTECPIPASLKAGKYSFKGVVYSSSDTAKSKPFNITVIIKKTPKTVGSLGTKGKVLAGTGNVVNIPFDSSKANLSDLQILSIKNANINGIPTEFTKYFTVDGFSMKYKAGAPSISKNTSVTGWVKYKYLSPSGWVQGEKKVTITIIS